MTKGLNEEWMERERKGGEGCREKRREGVMNGGKEGER